MIIVLDNRSPEALRLGHNAVFSKIIPRSIMARTKQTPKLSLTEKSLEKQWRLARKEEIQKAEEMLTEACRSNGDLRHRLSLNMVLTQRIVARKVDGCGDTNHKHRYLLADLRPRTVKILLAGDGPLNKNFSDACGKVFKKLSTLKGALAFR